MLTSMTRRIRMRLARVRGQAGSFLRRTRWKLRSRPVPIDVIRAELLHGGIRRGDLLVVHSALSKLGRVEGGASAVCTMLEELVGPEGTLVMPTFHQPLSILEMLRVGLVVDLRVAPSHTGKLSEEFRVQTDVLRSSHPFSSCSAWGARKVEIATGHDRSPFLCGPGSPLSNVWELGGKLLGLGVGLGPVSFYHVLEDTWAEYPVRTRLDQAFECSYITATGETITRDLFVLDNTISRTRIEVNEWFRRWFRAYLIEVGILKEFPVGQAVCWTMECRALYDELKALAKEGITIYTTQATFPRPWQRTSRVAQDI